MNFKDKLLDLRKKAGLSQEELGYKLNVSRQTISKWEIGKSTPELDKLVVLSEIFNVSLDELVKDIDTSNKDVVRTRKNNKYVLLIIWLVICVILAFILYRYLSVRRVIKEYNSFMNEAKKTGGMVTIMKIVNSQPESDRAYTTHYFKDDIEYIQYFESENHGDTNVSSLHKTVFKDKQNVYTIDEVNKTYTVMKRMSFSENGPLDEIELKININLLSSVYVRFPNIYITFNKNYHTKIDKRGTDPNKIIMIGLQKGNPVHEDDIYALTIDNKNVLSYIENIYNSSDRTKMDSNSYYYSNIGKTLEQYLQLPDLTNYTLVEE